MTFPCTACGHCCRKVVAGTGFPAEWVGENGTCVNLGEDNLCRIYETRPDVCRISSGFKFWNGTLESYYLANAKVCNALMDAAGSGTRIDITVFGKKTLHP